MKASAELRVPCRDEATARRLLASLAVDDDQHVASRRDGTDITVVVHADDPGSLLAALDDVLACLTVAVDVDELAGA